MICFFSIKGNSYNPFHISPSVLLLSESGELGVRTVNDQNEVQFQRITILEDSMEGVWVSGLPNKIKIITVGQEYVFQGQTVKILETVPPQA